MTTTTAALGERALRRLGVAVVPVADRPALAAPIAVATLATSALVWLAVISADETPGTLDQALAVSKVLAVHDALIAQGFVSWPNSAIPQAVSEDYVMLAVLHLASSFGKAGDPSQQAVLEARIRRVATIIAAPALATEAVMAVHSDLAARGKVRWTVFDIPSAAEAPYVWLAANRLAPAFELKANPNDDAEATRSLVQMIALGSSGERVMAEYF